jgi:Kef-type K+ transport system membrane component KefB
VGLALFIFTVGLGSEAGVLRRHGRTAAAISIGSILLPFALGLVLVG